MANQVNAKLVLKTEGLDEAEAKASRLHKTIKAGQDIFKKGFRSVMGDPLGDKADSMGYGYARSSVGTGAAGRDFAKEARGLGGLVRVYATFAANLFAVGAAYTALSAAADTTNMVRGLDQLGAASGKNLGTLSKRIVELTDGAVSLKEAMQATAKASSAGLTNTQIETLTSVAKNASQALGLNMPDALSRLTRAVTKLEPELIDELGLFTKIGPATENYARSIGKSATSLTDFERRQAFANAVLQEGVDKFGKLQIDSNPYDKLLATLKNVTQVGLELVNKVLGPIVGALASSPTALAFGLAGIVSTLIKQALPAVLDFKQSLISASEEAAAVVGKKALAARKAEQSFRDNIADNMVLKMVDTENRIKELVKTSKLSGSNSVQLKNILDADPTQVTQRQLSFLEKQSKSAAVGKELAAAYAELRNNIIGVQKADTEYNNSLNAGAKALSTRWLLEKQLSAAIRENTRSTIVATATENASVEGPVRAFKRAMEEIRQARRGIEVELPTGRTIEKDGKKVEETEKKRIDGISRTQALMTGVSSAASIAASSVANLAGAFMGWVAVIGVIVAAGAILIGWLSNTSKESENTKKAMDRLDDSFKGAIRTIDYLNDKPVLEQLSQSSLSAKANAINEITDALRGAIAAADKELNKMNWLDKLVESVKGAFNGGVKATLAENIAESLKLGFQLSSNDQASQAAKDAISKLLNVDVATTNVKELTNTISTLGPTSNSVKLVSQELSKLTTISQLSAARGKEVSESWTAANNILLDFQKSSLPSDNLSKLGTAMTVSALKLTEALKDPNQQLTVMRDLLKDSNAIKLFPTEVIGDIAKFSENLDYLARESVNTSKELGKLDTEIAELTAKKDRFIDLIVQIPAHGGARNSNAKAALQKQLENIVDDLNSKQQKKINIEADVVRSRQEIEAATSIFSNAAKAQFVAGANQIGNRLADEFNKASVILPKGLADLLGQTEIGAKLRSRFEQQSLAMQAETIKSEQTLQITIEKNTAVLQQQLLEYQRTKFENSGDSISARSLTPQIAALEERIKLLSQTPQQLLARGGSRGMTADYNAGRNPEFATPDNINLIQRLEGFAAKLTTIGAQTALVKVKERIDVETARTNEVIERLSLQQTELKIKQNLLSVSKSILGNDNIATLQAERQLKLAESDIDFNKKNQEIIKDITAKELLYNELKKTGKLTAADELSFKSLFRLQVEKILDIEKQRQGVKISTELQLAYDILKAQNAEHVKAIEFLQKYDELVKAGNTQDLENAKAVLEYQEKIGMYGESDLVRRKSSLDLQSLQLEKAAQYASLEAERAKTSADFALRQAAIDSIPDDAPGKSEEKDKLDKDIRKQNTLYSTQKAILDRVFSRKQDILEVTSKTTLEQAKFNELAGTLEGIFGNLGRSVAEFAKAIVDSSKRRAEFDARELELQEKKRKNQEALNNANNSDSYFELKKEEHQLDEEIFKNRREQSNTEYNDQIRGLSLAKKIFSEKTVAHKVLSGIEKAVHVAKLAMWVKESGMEALMTAKSIAMSGAKAVADGTAAVVNALKSVPFPFNIAAAAATAAIVASLIGKRPNVGRAAGSSAAERQEVQGTGTSFDPTTGKRIENGSGVFGDATAKSTSIADSLSRIKETGLKNLSFTNRMVTILESIDKGINGAAKVLYSVNGIRTGSQFGTSEGTNTSGIIGLFGSSTSKEISDAGIKFVGTFSDIMNGVVGSIKAYEDVVTTRNRSGFLGIGRSTSTSTSTNTKNVGEDVMDQFTSIFANVGELFREAGKNLGRSEDEIAAQLAQVSLDGISASLRGLKGDDLAKELNAVIGNIVDRAATSLFAGYAKYQEFGEGMAETVLRIADTDKKVKEALQSMGLSISKFSGLLPEASIEITQALVTAAGGVDGFISQVERFSDNFLTESERLKPVQDAVVREMTRLGFASVDTKEEFKNLVLGLDLTNSANRTTYAALLNVADAFNEVYSATTKTISAEELRSKMLDYEIQKQKLLGNVSTAVSLARAEELRQLSQYPAAEARRLQSALETIRALEDATSYRKLEVDLLRASGRPYKATLAQREIELATLTESEKLIKKQIYAAEDAYSSQSLLLELMDLEGKATESLIIKRERELNALSAGDAAIKRRIYLLQDEKAKTAAKSNIDKKINELLGNSSANLAAARTEELETTDEALRAALRYQYALEDEVSIREKLIEARDRETEALKSTIEGLESSIGSLQEYRRALLVSDKSVLTPAQKYEQAKTEAQKLAAIAISSATTEVEKRARDEAISKLPNATDAWLEASRNLFASSDTYQQDFSTVLDILDQTSSSLALQKTDAEKQLDELEKSTSFLDSISNNTASAAVLLQQYLDASQATKTAQANMNLSEFFGTTELQYSIDNVGTGLSNFADMLQSVADRFSIVDKVQELPPIKVVDPVINNLQESNANMAAEIASLNNTLANIRDEINALRREQAAQTAEVIATNVAVTRETTEVIGESGSTWYDANWSIINQPSIQS